jgi:D-arabinose 1-dehydrogenase-like Zn-dependent alcohol dehydrogenase
VQFAAKMGCRTVAVARGTDKEPFARKLGAHHYINSTSQNVAQELTRLGGAKVILATLTDAKSMSDAVTGLSVDGKLMVIGASLQPIEVSTLALILARRSISGWPSGTSKDSEDTLAFSVLSSIRAVIETYPLARAAEAYERMMSGKARFRVVLTMEN